MKINMRKSIVLITMTLALAVICGGAASAATSYNVDIKYYNATNFDPATVQAGTAIPITQEYTGENVVKVITITNTGDSNGNAAIVTDTQPTQMTNQGAVIYTLSAAGAWSNVPVVLKPLPGWNYDATTGVWNVGNMGYNNAGAVPTTTDNWKQMLMVGYTLKTVDTDTGTTDSATVTYTTPPANINGNPTGTANFTILAKTNVTIGKLYTIPDNTAVLTTVKWNVPINVVFNLYNDGPSAAQSVTVNDTINASQLLYDTSRAIQYYNGVFWSTTPIGTVSIVNNNVTWNLGSLPSKANYMISVPYIVKASGTTINNVATETQTNLNINPAATKSGIQWSLTSANAALTVPKANLLNITKVFVNGSNVPVTSTYYGDNNLYALIAVTNTGPDAANWVVAEDLLNPLLWTIDYSKIQTSYDGGITWATNDTNVYMLGNYLAWIVSPRKVTQTELALLMAQQALTPSILDLLSINQALLPSGATALIKIPITATITGTPAILGTNAAAIPWYDAKYSMNVGSYGLVPHPYSLAEIAIQRGADLGIVKSVSDNTPDAGDVITFTLTATNSEDINAVGNLVKAKVTDIINPNYFKFINITFKNVTNPSVPYVNNYTYDAATGKLVWTIGNLDDGAWIQALVTVQVLKNAATAAVENTATIEGWWQNTLPIENYPIHDLDPSNNSSTVSVNVNGTTIPPLTVVSTTPSNNSDYYGLTKPVYITFSNAVSLTGAGSVLIKNLTSGVNISAPVVTVSGSQLKIQFAKSRLKNNVYQITIPAGLVVDQYGQKNAAFTLTFTAKA